MKRFVDIAAAFIGAILVLPIVVMAMIAIRRDSPGPVLFAQKRVGQHGKVFTCYKLRTMRHDTGDRPSHEVDASAVTPVGAKLRLWKIDEIPQLWNVLLGEMSLVGPRPCLPSQTQLIEARRTQGVLTLKPGITGIAQVRGIDMSEPDRLATVDAEYLRDPSLMRDVLLVFATIFGAGRGDAVR